MSKRTWKRGSMKEQSEKTPLYLATYDTRGKGGRIHAATSEEEGKLSKEGGRGRQLSTTRRVVRHGPQL